MLLQIGSLIKNTYKVVRLAARGGMALLYEVHHQELDLPLALKVLLCNRSTEPEQVRYFLDEARAVARLQRELDGVPFLVDLGEIEGHPYAVMEWLQGETLAERLRRQGPLGIGAALTVVEQVARVLAVAHRHGIVHRDIKPLNLMLCRQAAMDDGPVEVVKVLDFGIARVPPLTGQERPETQPGTLLGSPEYMAPEQARGDATAVGPATDQYALAMLTYAMLSGHSAFPLTEGSPEAFIRHLQTITQQPPPPLPLHVGSQVEQVILRGLAKPPQDRFASVIEWVHALRAAKDAGERAPTRRSDGASSAQQEALPAMIPPLSLQKEAPSPSLLLPNGLTSPARWATVGLLALGAVGLLVGLLLRGWPKSEPHAATSLAVASTRPYEPLAAALDRSEDAPALRPVDAAASVVSDAAVAQDAALASILPKVSTVLPRAPVRAACTVSAANQRGTSDQKKLLGSWAASSNLCGSGGSFVLKVERGEFRLGEHSGGCPRPEFWDEWQQGLIRQWKQRFLLEDLDGQWSVVCLRPGFMR